MSTGFAQLPTGYKKQRHAEGRQTCGQFTVLGFPVHLPESPSPQRFVWLLFEQKMCMILKLLKSQKPNHTVMPDDSANYFENRKTTKKIWILLEAGANTARNRGCRLKQ